MSRGKRYSGEKKLNLKKVFAVIVALAVIVMFIIMAVKMLRQKPKVEEKSFQNGYFRIYENGKWGVINSKGEEIIKPTYDEMIVIPDSTKEVFLYTESANYVDNSYKINAINEKGEKIFGEYDNILPIENYDTNYNLWYEKNALKVQKADKFGLIDLNGKELLPIEYDEISAIKGVKNVLITRKDDLYGLVDNLGNIIIENKYAEITTVDDKYEHGFIVKNSEGKYGLISYDKKQVLEEKYNEIKHVYGNNQYIANENGNWIVVNSSGETVLASGAENIVAINGDLYVVQTDGKYGIVDNQNNQKVDPTYDGLEYAFSDYYIAKKDDKYGIINSNNETKVEFKYKSIYYDEEGNYIQAEKEDYTEDLMNSNLEVKVSGIVSEINNELNYIKVREGNDYKYYNFKFEEKDSKDILTSNSLFLSKKDDKYGFVNQYGVVVVDYIYDDATEQNKYGFAAVKKDGKWGAINFKGEVTAGLEYTLENNLVIDFIGAYHLAEDLNANYYTK